MLSILIFFIIISVSVTLIYAVRSRKKYILKARLVMACEYNGRITRCTIGTCPAKAAKARLVRVLIIDKNKDSPATRCPKIPMTNTCADNERTTLKLISHNTLTIINALLEFIGLVERKECYEYAD